MNIGIGKKRKAGENLPLLYLAVVGKTQLATRNFF
jgi:hypothetical protein